MEAGAGGRFVGLMLYSSAHSPFQRESSPRCCRQHGREMGRKGRIGGARRLPEIGLIHAIRDIRGENDSHAKHCQRGRKADSRKLPQLGPGVPWPRCGLPEDGPVLAESQRSSFARRSIRLVRKYGSFSRRTPFREPWFVLPPKPRLFLRPG